MKLIIKINQIIKMNTMTMIKIIIVIMEAVFLMYPHQNILFNTLQKTRKKNSSPTKHKLNKNNNLNLANM